MTWRRVGDRALLRTFEGDVAGANAEARALAARLRAQRDPAIEDVVPGARTVLVVLLPGTEPPELPTDGEPAREQEGRTHEFRVEYDGDDLPDVASMHGLSADDVVRLHSDAEYTVAFLGFTPGFAYLLGLPPELETSRLATPRSRVPAGSVAIAGPFGGIYPRATPGGWRLLGRTEADLFDPSRDPPAALAPGDRVRFVPA